MPNEQSKQVRLKVIHEPVDKTPALRVFGGRFGDVVYEVQSQNDEPRLLCGYCGFVFAVGVYRGKLRGVVFHCVGCGAFNVADPLDD